MENDEILEEMLQELLKENNIFDFDIYFSLLSSSEAKFNYYKNEGFSEKKALELTKSYLQTELSSSFPFKTSKPKGSRYLSWITLFFLLFYVSTIISYSCGIYVWSYCEASTGAAFLFSIVFLAYTLITHKKRKKIDFVISSLLFVSTLSFAIQGFNFYFKSGTSNSFFTMEYSFPGIFYLKKWLREETLEVSKTLLNVETYFDPSPIVSLISFIFSFFYESARR